MRTTWRRLFINHPASVGETYIEHCIHAVEFGASMLRGSMACFLHAAIPGHSRWWIYGSSDARGA
jgi:hypothetical protein